MEYTYMTKEGYDKYLAEIRQLETVERPKIIQSIAEARDKGDLSENAEYSAAKDAQILLENKINEMRLVLNSVKLIDPSDVSTDEVQILTTVTFHNHTTGTTSTYQIVSQTEANIEAGKISVNTPIALGLLGHKKGDVVEVQVPRGLMTLEILDISL